LGKRLLKVVPSYTSVKKDAESFDFELMNAAAWAEWGSNRDLRIPPPFVISESPPKCKQKKALIESLTSA
jgi:hypothetical protein